MTEGMHVPVPKLNTWLHIAMDIIKSMPKFPLQISKAIYIVVPAMFEAYGVIESSLNDQPPPSICLHVTSSTISRWTEATWIVYTIHTMYHSQQQGFAPLPSKKGTINFSSILAASHSIITAISNRSITCRPLSEQADSPAVFDTIISYCFLSKEKC